MAATFTVKVKNGLSEPIASEEITVDVELPAGWGLLHVADDTSYPIFGDSYDIPLSEKVENGETAAFTFTVGERKDYQLPEPEQGQLKLTFSYDNTPLKQTTVYLPPGRRPVEE